MSETKPVTPTLLSALLTLQAVGEVAHKYRYRNFLFKDNVEYIITETHNALVNVSLWYLDQDQTPNPPKGGDHVSQGHFTKYETEKPEK